ncbi:early nodulin-like protein 8 [Ziziphus jujuba]|uniref:Early nodulin-like protein 8 n=1 Tax=Ziziphus jujuba TaxID=326968 RepID=A0A6P4AMB8_ZIZJJ|nr:early nodulin-like protein 8 [Ziziphus jujuba]
MKLKMASLRSPKNSFCLAFLFLAFVQTQVLCYQYKVGDLDSWGIPSSANPQVYAKWSKYHTFRIGDSLLFLYPPSQDSVIQVTAQSYNSCNLKDPILYMNNGNSLFNITSEGQFFFTSGESGHCEKKQKLYITVGNASAAYSPSYGPSAMPETSPSYPTVFGTIPAPPSYSPSLNFPVFMASAIGFMVCALLGGIM